MKNYYGPKGAYLKEHKNYFTKNQLKIDLDFLIKALKLKKTDKILDLACGHGRHTLLLKKLGFNIDGADSSSYLIGCAKKQAVKQNLKIEFFVQDIHKFKLKESYDKVFLFFSEFGLFKVDIVLKNVNKILKKDGLFFLDTDNINRVKNYSKKHPKSSYYFDYKKNQLRDKKNSKLIVKYYEVAELKEMFNKNGFKVIAVYGNYKRDKINSKSKRTIILARKK